MRTLKKSWFFWTIMMIAAFCWMTAVGYFVFMVFVDSSISPKILLVSATSAISLSIFIHHFFFFLPAKKEAAELTARFQKYQ